MSISKITAVAASVVVLGGALALLANHDTTPAEKVSTPSPPPAESAAAVPEPSVQPGAATSGGGAGNAKPYSANAELAKLEAMSPHPSKDEFARRLSVKHDQLLKDLTKDLGLSAVHATSIKDVLVGRLKTFRAALETGPQPGDSPGDSLTKEKEMLAKAGGIIWGAGLREDLSGILSAKQLAAFDEREAKSWQTQVESLAYRELAKLTPVLNLTEDQKDRAFELLKKSSSEKLDKDADMRAFMALQQNQPPARMELTDLAEAEFLAAAFDGPNPLKPDSPEFKQRITEVVGGQIQKQVELLAPVLDPRQKQRYRDHLVQKSLLPQFGIKLPTPEKP